MTAEPHPSVVEQAMNYLRAELGEYVPESIRFEANFDEKALDGEGAASVFSFEARVGGGECSAGASRFYVVSGETATNYFPAYGFDADDAYSFHIGTIFMVKMRVSRIADEDEPAGARESLQNLIRAYIHSEPTSIGPAQVAAVFRCEDFVFVVYRIEIEDRPVYAMGGDCPPGFYTLTEYPPQTALRLHLGKVIREEARRDAGYERERL
jgi:hypothetical protein